MYEKFEKLCAEKGVTPYKVSKETGVSTATLTSWKQGKYSPKKEKLQKIADFFGVPVSYFYDESSKIPVINFLSGVGGLNKGFQGKNGKYNVHIEIIDEPEIHIHSKYAYDLVKKMKDMPDEDLEFLLKTAEKISPTPQKEIPAVQEKSYNKMHQKFTNIEDARDYLNSFKPAISAFGGGKNLSDDAIIDMANLIYEDKNK